MYKYEYVSADLSQANTSLPTTPSPFLLPPLGARPGRGRRASQRSPAAEIKEFYPPGIQTAGIQDLGASMLKSWDLIILSSFIGDLLRRNRLPQDATGCTTFCPRHPADLYKSVLPPAQ